MRVLTIKQPWAGLIIAGRKTVENRSWKPSAATLPEGARFAIHAGLGAAKIDDPELQRIVDAEPLCKIRGAIIGTVEFAGILSPDKCNRTDAKWWFREQYGWKLRNPKRRPRPLKCKGRLQLWTADL